jgi:hypothetical protein
LHGVCHQQGHALPESLEECHARIIVAHALTNRLEAFLLVVGIVDVVALVLIVQNHRQAKVFDVFLGNHVATLGITVTDCQTPIGDFFILEAFTCFALRQCAGHCERNQDEKKIGRHAKVQSNGYFKFDHAVLKKQLQKIPEIHFY